MATTYSTEANGYLNTVPASLASGAVHEARTRRYRATITLASQAIGDTVVLAKVPPGAAFAFGVITSTVSLGTATVAIGTSASTGKYRTAAVFTATDTPTMFGNTAAVSASALSAAETISLTVAVAALPASGTLVVDLYFSGV